MDDYIINRWDENTICSVGFGEWMFENSFNLWKDVIGLSKAVSLLDNWRCMLLARDDSVKSMVKDYNPIIYTSLHTDLFNEYISKCTFLCTACSKNSVYMYDRLCGTLAIAISNCIPLIIDANLLKLYNIPPTACFVYDIDTFNLSMIQNISFETYRYMSLAMKQYRDTVFELQRQNWRLLQ